MPRVANEDLVLLINGKLRRRVAIHFFGLEIVPLYHKDTTVSSKLSSPEI